VSGTGTKKAPAYQWFPKDFETDEAVKLMTYEQEGIYRRLLDHQSLHGSIPSDPQDVAKLLPKIQLQDFLALWPALAPKFPTRAGRRVNRKLERVKDDFAAFLTRKGHGGRASAQLRLQVYGTAQPQKPQTAIPVDRGAVEAPSTSDRPPVDSAKSAGTGLLLDPARTSSEQLFESLFRTTIEPASASASASAEEKRDLGISPGAGAVERLLPELRTKYGRRKPYGHL
jgi:hypothetical protein